MQFHELELSVGDVLHIGEKTITVIDVDDGEVTFRIDDPDSHDDDLINSVLDNSISPVPR